MFTKALSDGTACRHMPSIFSSRSLFYRVTMEVLCQLLKSVERFQLFIYFSRNFTSYHCITFDRKWVWKARFLVLDPARKHGKGMWLFVLLMSFSIDYCTSISSACYFSQRYASEWSFGTFGYRELFYKPIYYLRSKL